MRAAEALIRAAPDELPVYALSLTRSLLHAQLPQWADEEAPPPPQQKGAAPAAPAEPVQAQRFRSLVAVVTAVPEQCGVALATEFYSPSLDTSQRAMLLQALSTAAHEIAAPGSFLKPLPGITSPLALSDSTSQGGSSGSFQPSRGALAGPQLDPGGGAARGSSSLGSSTTRRVGTVTRASERSLAAGRRPAPAAHANRFPPLALQWAAALLSECDVRKHGVDLLGRDHFLLGRLLLTLGKDRGF